MKNTKRVFIAAIIALISFGVANAEFRWGVRAGLNINSLNFKEVPNPKNLNENACGWNAGVMADFTVPIIGIGMDASLMYSRMNNGAGEITTLPNVGEFTGEEKSIYGRNFIEIPINIKYKLSLPVVDKIVRPYIYTGPSFAVKLDKNAFENFKTKTCQIAWNVGIGVELFNHLQVYGSYGFGINNICDQWLGFESTDIKLKNNYWTIGLGYLF